MWRHQSPSPEIRSAGRRRVAGRPLTGRQERLFLYVVFAIGAALQLAAVLRLLPFLG